MPIDELYDTPGFLIRRCRQIAAAIFAREAAAFDVTAQQYTVLRALAEFPQLEQSALCDVTALDRSTVATLLARLEEKQLARRTPSPHDRRKNHVALTASGRRLVREIEPVMRHVQELIVAPLPEADRAAFTRMLERIVHAYEESDLPRAALGDVG